MLFHPRFTELGQLELLEIYGYHDRPVLLACKNESGTLFISVLTEEDARQESWLFARVSRSRLERIRAGQIDLHDAFAQAEESLVYTASFPHDPVQAVAFNSMEREKLNDALLPARGERLHLPPARRPEAPDVKRIRADYRLSQSDFAALLGISIKTLRDWEHGRRAPIGPARVLLQVAANHPEALRGLEVFTTH